MTFELSKYSRNKQILVYAIIPAKFNAVVNKNNDSICNFDTIEFGSYAAVIESGFGANFKNMHKEDIAKQLIIYQQKIEFLMCYTPLLPVKFGTFLPDVASVCNFISSGIRVFETAFAAVANCVQFEISVLWDLKKVYAEIAIDPVINILKQSAMASGSDDKSREIIGRKVKDLLEYKRNVITNILTCELRKIATDTVICQTICDNMVCHIVLLVKSKIIPEINNCLEIIDSKFNGQLKFCLLGPLAPYNFATIEIKKIDAIDISEARKILNVGPDATMHSIKNSYYCLVKKIHPDVNKSIINAKEEAIALNDAYNLLLLLTKTDLSYNINCETSSVDLSRLIVSVHRQEGTSDVDNS
jgi:hypothetical protein